MTIKEFAIDYLTQTIGFPNTIRDIWEIIYNDIRFEEIKDCWDIATEDYPKSFLPVIIILINAICLEYLKNKNPDHFLIPFFDGSINE